MYLWSCGVSLYEQTPLRTVKQRAYHFLATTASKQESSCLSYIFLHGRLRVSRCYRDIFKSGEEQPVDFNYSEKNISTFLKWMYGWANMAIRLFCLANRRRLTDVCCDELSETIAQTRGARVCMRDRQLVLFPESKYWFDSAWADVRLLLRTAESNACWILSIYIFSSFVVRIGFIRLHWMAMFVSLFLVPILLLRQRRRRRPYTCSLKLHVYNVYRCYLSHFIQRIYTIFIVYFGGEWVREYIVLNFVYHLRNNKK